MELETRKHVKGQPHLLPYQAMDRGQIQVTHYQGTKRINLEARCDKCGETKSFSQFAPAFTEFGKGKHGKWTDLIVLLCWTCWNNY